MAQQLMCAAERIQVEEGQCLYRPGDALQYMYFVEEGALSATMFSCNDSGETESTVKEFSEGEAFGESCLLYLNDDAKYTRNFSAYAATDCLVSRFGILFSNSP